MQNNTTQQKYQTSYERGLWPAVKWYIDKMQEEIETTQGFPSLLSASPLRPSLAPPLPFPLLI
jgi:hypothetical protein